MSDLAAAYGMAKSTISTIIKNKEVIKRADVAKGVTVISKQRPPILQEVEKLLLVYINEVQLKGDIINESFICEEALEIYDDLLKKTLRQVMILLNLRLVKAGSKNLRTEVKYIT